MCLLWWWVRELVSCNVGLTQSRGNNCHYYYYCCWFCWGFELVYGSVVVVVAARKGLCFATVFRRPEVCVAWRSALVNRIYYYHCCYWRPLPLKMVVHCVEVVTQVVCVCVLWWSCGCLGLKNLISHSWYSVFTFSRSQCFTRHILLYIYIRYRYNVFNIWLNTYIHTHERLGRKRGIWGKTHYGEKWIWSSMVGCVTFIWN